MAMTMTGYNVKGIQIIGSEFLEPTQIPGCLAWYKWQTGISVDASSKVTSWSNQATPVAGGPGNFFSHATTRRPPYTPATGLIQFDGVNHYLRVDTTLNGVEPEFTFVVRMNNAPMSSGRFFGKTLTGAAADTDAISFAIFPNSSYKHIAGVGGFVTRTVEYPAGIGAGRVCVAGFRRFYHYINGVEPGYVSRSNGTLTGATPTFINIGASCYNFGGTLYNLPMNVGYLEWCWHSNTLTTLQRTKLHNYFKLKHQIP